MRTDTIFYQLFQTIPSLLFELIGESPTIANSYRFSSKEVKAIINRMRSWIDKSKDAITNLLQ
jgi:predicted transposase YdaD